MAQDLHIVGFRVGRENYGVPIEQVHEIVRVPEVTPVPEAPAYVEGVINLRGRIVSIIDMRKLLRHRETQPGKKNRILVVELGDKMVGLIVDSASEVLKIPASEIDPSPGAFQEKERSYVTGVGKLNGRLMILLDLSRILERSHMSGLAIASEAVASAVQAAR